MTFAEIAYMALDELKLLSDDSDYTPDHLIFLADKYRAYLLEQKYSSKTSEVSSENFQEICLDLERVTNINGVDCSEPLLRTTKKIPDIMNFTILNISANTVMSSPVINFVSFDRLPYVGKNKWTSGLIYASRGRDNYLYLKSSNPQFLYLSKIKIFGVFSDSKAAAEASCDGACDIMDKTFPLEADLVPLTIQYVVKELSGQRYMPRDKQNNAADDMAGLASATPRNINKKTTTADE